MSYQGDVYDTPPMWLRILFAFAVLAGGILMVVHLATHGHGTYVIITLFCIILAEYFLVTTPKAANIATTTVLFLLYLSAVSVMLP